MFAFRSGGWSVTNVILQIHTVHHAMKVRLRMMESSPIALAAMAQE
jgi:hypothetical protein